MESMQNNQADTRIFMLNEKLNALSPSIFDCSIYKVHNELREVNKKAYEPVLVSIGPYHRGNEKLLVMEEYKLRYLRQAVQLRNGNLKYYLSAMRSMVERARTCYAEHVELNDDEFAEMLLLDSCFVVEVMREFCGQRRGERLIRRMYWMIAGLQRDLMLFENQLPFFVILRMFDLIVGAPNQIELFIHSALLFFYDLFLPWGEPAILDPQYRADLGYVAKEFKHLLEMIHEIWVLKYKGSNQDVDFNVTRFLFIPSASKLIEAGIKFEIAEGGSMFDITFKNGVINIPKLRIEDGTECFLRNLIVYEQYKDRTSRLPVTDYAALLDSLINTSKDVEILCKSGIVDNWLGDNEVVSGLFNKILDSAVVEHFHYADLCNKVNAHYNKKMNRWLAKLKQNYLNTPWAVISLVAAIILLVLTLIQTVVAVVSA